MRLGSLVLLGLLAQAVSAGGNPAFAPDAPPVLSRVTASSPNAQHEVTISGAAGAVLPQSWLLVINLNTSHYSVVRAVADGSFAATLVAPAGTTIEIKADPYGKALAAFATDRDWSRLTPVLGALPGTVFRLPDSAGSGTGIRFSGGTRAGTPAAYATVEGTVNKLTFTPGETVTIEARVTLVAPSVEGSAQITGNLSLNVVRVSTAEGREIAMRNRFGSMFMTPTGLPVERGECGGTTFGQTGAPFVFGPFTAGRAELTRTLTMTLPADLPAGYYQPFLTFFFQNLPSTAPPASLAPVSGTLNFFMGIDAPLIRVGEPAPPRLFTLLFADIWSEGTRGLRAIEDRPHYGMVPHVATQTDVVVLPKNRYRLEPHLPVMSISDRGFPDPGPRFPLKFPSGSLIVHLTRPDGSTADIGPAPILQARIIAPARESGESFEGGAHPGDVYQVSTMDSRFDVDFLQYGRYRIVLEGSVEDLWGTVWRIGGTYDVIVAETLVLDTAALPGTPLEVGDRLPLTLTTIPPVPAFVEASFRLAPESDASRMRETVVRGRANRYGFFRPFEESVRVQEPGEYRLDVSATWIDPAGVWWAGSRTWGGVVAPRQSPLIAHGRRGFLTQDTTPRQAWYIKSQLGSLRPDSHATFPFHSGDVAWLGDTAMLVAVTMQDTTGEVDGLIRSRCHGGGPDVLPGETVPTSSRADGLDAHFDPTVVDLWSYAYSAVERPLIRVRENIADGLYGHGFGYWTFRAHYGAQLGVANGDLPNDIKFMFGGVVARGSALKQPRYGIYGSLFVLIGPDEGPESTRVFPPFQSNGGPIMRLLGKPVDLFFHPTAVRPGTVLERGSRASLAGYVGPPLPAKVEIMVTSPSGVQRVINGQANAIGLWSDPSTSFTVGESGVWKAKVKVSFDGSTSAGPVAPPYPTGDLLGSRNGELSFFVVDPDAPPLGVSSGPVAFTVNRPPGLSNVELAYTTTMPGFILETGTQSSMTYTYDAPRLSSDFPNLDVDTVTISLLLSGTDASGTRRHFARQIVFQGQEVLLTTQTPERARRRAVRK